MSLDSHAQALADSLAKAQLVPGVASELIPEGFTPKTRLEISYAGKSTEQGTFFRASECKVAPTIKFQPVADAHEDDLDNPKGAYLLILIDPDAPTPDDPKFAFWRHWVLPGLQPLSGDSGIVGETKPALTEYLGPGPKDDSKPHRYLFLLYREPAAMDLAKAQVGGEEFIERRSFKPADFAKNHDLTLVGVNWMTCAGDGWEE